MPAPMRVPRNVSPHLNPTTVERLGSPSLPTSSSEDHTPSLLTAGLSSGTGGPVHLAQWSPPDAERFVVQGVRGRLRPRGFLNSLTDPISKKKTKVDPTPVLPSLSDGLHYCVPRSEEWYMTKWHEAVGQFIVDEERFRRDSAACAEVFTALATTSSQGKFKSAAQFLQDRAMQEKTVSDPETLPTAEELLRKTQHMFDSIETFMDDGSNMSKELSPKFQLDVQTSTRAEDSIHISHMFNTVGEAHRTLSTSDASDMRDAELVLTPLRRVKYYRHAIHLGFGGLLFFRSAPPLVHLGPQDGSVEFEGKALKIAKDLLKLSNDVAAVLNNATETIFSFDERLEESSTWNSLLELEDWSGPVELGDGHGEGKVDVELSAFISVEGAVAFDVFVRGFGHAAHRCGVASVEERTKLFEAVKQMGAVVRGGISDVSETHLNVPAKDGAIDQRLERQLDLERVGSGIGIKMEGWI
ncbi:hypothetical protein M427DRAFT_30730 [Gonapodya prolifera JEL478]|uniref:Uncharacterized protein n=1 Tax=Gonapodya prolifera (strain JEL478) TaxID=1344416 RepID=A0A139AJC7_GONPJ|nr:hypothetical protein M427DRAFT_30730 [Gonapodya prolifera JEL478]|eukprot:KXS16891.1 hypothetical protein M427DRAFT_30730 [Gonapodya prolifera JEL478]